MEWRLWQLLIILILCKNNYYYALTSESAQNPPPNILLSHTGIADSGATDFYFAPDAPVTNYNPQAPTVGVRVANGRPKRSVASATLSSVPSLPQAAMTGHVMPAFPHTLIDLGPFADLDCKIVFTKTSVTVYHPDGHPLLSGWRDQTGPRLWHFPHTAEAAQMALDIASPQPPIPITAEAAHVAGDTASHPPQRSPPPSPRAPPADVRRTPKKRKWRKRRPRSSQAAGKQRRHASPRRRVTFTLPPQHVDKDRGNGYSVLLAVCSAICPASFGCVLPICMGQNILNNESIIFMPFIFVNEWVNSWSYKNFFVFIHEWFYFLFYGLKKTI